MEYPVVIRLSKTSKMPCSSFSLPAEECITGSKLRSVEGSVCSNCYARKGLYRMPSVREPRDWNFAVLVQCLKTLEGRDTWVRNMVGTIGSKAEFFRWHDSGDIQSLQHLKMIIRVAELMPTCKFWLPTHEAGILKAYKGTIPENLIIRLSGAMLGLVDTLEHRPNVKTSSVNSKLGHHCGAYDNGGKCGSCRVCWDVTVQNVDYPLH